MQFVVYVRMCLKLQIKTVKSFCGVSHSSHCGFVMGEWWLHTRIVCVQRLCHFTREPTTINDLFKEVILMFLFCVFSSSLVDRFVGLVAHT